MIKKDKNDNQCYYMHNVYIIPYPSNNKCPKTKLPDVGIVFGVQSMRNE